MSTFISTLKDISGRVILPKTRTRAVYDDNNNRLDSILNEIETQLDTYMGLIAEKGSWTPVLQCVGDNAVNPTYTTYYSYAKYKNIDDLVYITCHCKYEITNAGSGYARIGGLPFTASNGCDGQGFALRECYGAMVDVSTEEGSTGSIDDSSTKIVVRDASGSLQRQFTTGTLWIGFSGVYLKMQ